MARLQAVSRMAELVLLPSSSGNAFSTSGAEPARARFFVAGFPYDCGPQLIECWRSARSCAVREPDNPHDPWRRGDPATATGSATCRATGTCAIAQRLDEGLPLSCRITAIDLEEGSFDAVEACPSPVIRD